MCVGGDGGEGGIGIKGREKRGKVDGGWRKGDKSGPLYSSSFLPLTHTLKGREAGKGDWLGTCPKFCK